MNSNVNLALQKAIKKIVSEITSNGELVDYKKYLEKKIKYDTIEKKYVENEKLRKQLGTDYQSSDSDEEGFLESQIASKRKVKQTVRDNLINKGFESSTFSPLPVCSNTNLQDDELPSYRNLEVLNIIHEEQQYNPYFGLTFLIQQLQKINKEQ